MSRSVCPKFDDCSAPLCPLQATTIADGIWYPDDEICQVKKFQSLDWIRKQKAIVRAKASADRFFTVKMLQAVRQVRKGIEGIDPDQPLKQAEEAERRWIAEKKGGRVIAKQNQKGGCSIAGKREDLVDATSNKQKEVNYGI